MVVVHVAPRIAWQRDFAGKIENGLRRLGVQYRFTEERHRTSDDLAILLGTSNFRAVENGPFLLVDRCSFGDTNKWVSLVRDGHGRRGDHRVTNPCPSRWERYAVPLQPWQSGKRIVVCGQHEAWAPIGLEAWYAAVAPHATHFRRHPAADNPTGLPETRNWKDVGRAITLNSSVAVDAVLNGVPTVTMDVAAMAWEVTAHDPRETTKPPRMPWLHWLAWTQWTHDEIAEGQPWQHLL